MTATAATPVFGPIVTSAPRAQPQAANDRFAFAALLDLLPDAEAKAGSSVGGDQSPTSNEPKQGGAAAGTAGLSVAPLVLAVCFPARLGRRTTAPWPLQPLARARFDAGVET